MILSNKGKIEKKVTLNNHVLTTLTTTEPLQPHEQNDCLDELSGGGLNWDQREDENKFLEELTVFCI